MTRPTRSLPRWVAAGALVGALGWWLPWIVSRSGAAALVLLALDLGDFWKFTAEWQTGLFGPERHAFFLAPPLAAMILALYAAGRRRPQTVGRERWLLLGALVALGALLLAGRLWAEQGSLGAPATLLLLLAAGVGLGVLVTETLAARNGWLPLLFFLGVVILPAFEFARPALAGTPLRYDDPYQQAEFGFQVALAALTLLSVTLIPLWSRLPAWGRALPVLLLALIGALAPPWAMWRSWPVMQSFYGGGAQVGIGLWIGSAGFLLAAAGAGWALRPDRRSALPVQSPDLTEGTDLAGMKEQVLDRRVDDLLDPHGAAEHRSSGRQVIVRQEAQRLTH